MTTFLASFDQDTQTGTIYSSDIELEMLFGLVDTTKWLPLASFSHGTPKPIPECFALDRDLEAGLANARVMGTTQTVEIA